MEENIQKQSTKEMKIIYFIEDLASSSPAPGGGAVAALSGGLSVALASMIYNLTIGKKIYSNLDEDIRNKLDKNLEECKTLCTQMLNYIDKDKEAFLNLMACYKMPKETQEDIVLKNEAMEKATLEAMNVPLNLAKLAMKFYDNIYFAVKYGNKNLVSDAKIAAIMLNACIESSMVNVEINLSFLKNQDIKRKIEKEMAQLNSINNSLKKDIMAVHYYN